VADAGRTGRSLCRKPFPDHDAASGITCFAAAFHPLSQHKKGHDMKFVLTSHNIKLTKSIENHILSRIEKLEHFDRWAIDARVNLEHDNTRSPERQFKCSIRLGVKGNDLYATDYENDLYAAIDLVTKKMEQQIRKRHSKKKAQIHTQPARAKAKRENQ
jgi:putative sigma-54 modulation protein